MTLAKGDLIGKLNKETGEAISPDDQGYVHFEVVELTISFNVHLPEYTTRDGEEVKVGQDAHSTDPYQLVLLRKVR